MSEPIHVLARDLRSVGIPYELDLTWSCLSRHHTALITTLGHLVMRGAPCLHRGLYRRTLAALRWVEALRARSSQCPLARATKLK